MGNLGHCFNADAKFIFSHRPDLKLIKLVNDETILLQTQVVYVVLKSVDN